jgi:tetratricopeptide (TPR) repeat protein
MNQLNQVLANLEQLLGQANNLQAGHDISKALSCYRLFLEAAGQHYRDGRREKIDPLFRQMVAAQPTTADAFHFFALMLQETGRSTAAHDALEMALALAPERATFQVSKARLLMQGGDVSGARESFDKARQLNPRLGEAADGMFACQAEEAMPGPDYYDFLRRFQEALKPRVYIEIGLGHGRSLAMAGSETTALGIDPYMGNYESLLYASPLRPAQLYPLTSDDFFSQRDVRHEMGNDIFDLAFIDGLHIFEQALRDFINLEPYAGKDSMVLIHDCLPIAPIVAERERCTGFWTGDVWRIIPCLKTFRPDLRIMTIPAKPSGLAVVTNLDPASTTLAENYDDIVRYYTTLRLPEHFAERRIVCNVMPAGGEGIIKLLPEAAKLRWKQGAL